MNCIVNSINAAHASIEAGYYDGTSVKVPTDIELQNIESALAWMSFVGKMTISGAVLSLPVTYLISSIPYLGPLMGLVTGVTSVVVGILGYDMQLAAQNLQDFAEKRVEHPGINAAHAFRRGAQISKIGFTVKLLKIAMRGAVIGGIMRDFIVARQCHVENQARVYTM